MTTWLSQHQKSETILDFSEAREDGVAVASAWTICKSFKPRTRQVTMPVPHHSEFLQAGCPSCHPTVSTHWRQITLFT